MSKALKLAEISQKVLDTWKDSDSSLSEIIAKEADRNSLNIEEIKRVIEASNTAAMLFLYKQTNDKSVEFPVAQFPHVLSLLKSESTSYPSNTDSFYERPSRNYIIDSVSSKSLHKKASVNTIDSEYSNYSIETLRQKALGQIENLEKVSSDLRIKIEEASQRIPRNLLKIAASLRRFEENFTEFENTSLHRFGDKSTAILDVLEKNAGDNNKRLIHKKATYSNMELADELEQVIKDLAFTKIANYEVQKLDKQILDHRQQIDYWEKEYVRQNIIS